MADVVVKTEKITNYFPTSPQSNVQCKTKKSNSTNQGPDVTKAKSTSSVNKDDCSKLTIKTELNVSDESCESPRPKRITESIPEKPPQSNNTISNKGNGKVKGKKKKTKPKSEPVDCKPKSETKTPLEKKTSKPNRVLTDYYPVRRSYRMTSGELKKQQERVLEEAILSEREDGIKVVDIEGKGRGVVSTRSFRRGEFVVEYNGELIDLASAKGRESKYSKDTNIGCYMYYFQFKHKSYCVDATAESGKLGRLLNHSRNGNCKTQVVGVGDRPYLILVAAKDIEPGEEMLYDYGDRNKETLEAHPWLAL